MTLHEALNYLSDPDTQARTRVILVPVKNWTESRQFFRERDCAEIRMSALIPESTCLPPPDEVFERVSEPGLLLGLDGYLALLDEENRRCALEAVKRLVDDEVAPKVTLLLKNSASNRALVRVVFSNPRYRERRQLIEIVTSQDETTETAQPEILLVGDEWKEYLPQHCDTFQSFLRKVEERPSETEVSRIVVQSDGRKLAGVSADVRQVMSLRDFAQIFYDIDDGNLSDDTVLWLMERGKEKDGGTLAEIVRRKLFSGGAVGKRILRVFSERTGAERETVLWFSRKSARSGSYLEGVVRQNSVTAETFQEAYIVGCFAIEATGSPESIRISFADERCEAIRELGTERAEADIRRFIESVKSETTAKVAPWLNCGTKVERAELLRRCAADGIVSNAVKVVYPEAAAYLGEGMGGSYFKEYRELKLTNRVTAEFCEKARNPPDVKFPSRDSLLQMHSVDSACALLVVDAMGAEWLPMILSLARIRNLGVESAEIGEARLPTATRFNALSWPEERRLLPEIKRFDNIAHNGAEAHEAHSAEENLAEQLEVIGSGVLPKVADALTRFERVLVTADHGSSRLATLAWQLGLVRTLEAPDNAEILDWRYCRKGRKACPLELEETLDGNYWVVRGYDRLPKGGGGGFERHGGAAQEEWLVPVVIFSSKGSFAAQEPTAKPVEFTENEDFDL